MGMSEDRVFYFSEKDRQILTRIATALEGSYLIKKEYADSQRREPEKITEKQFSYINHLMMELDLHPAWIYRSLSKEEASRLIDKLVKLKEQGKVEVEN
jgi:hypothetical protein